MEHTNGDKEDVDTAGIRNWGSARWGCVIGLLGAIEGLYGDEEYADLTIIRGKFPSSRKTAQVSVEEYVGIDKIEDCEMLLRRPRR